jgi:tRNA nucleotidyltransferase/poly(A) polymerase
MSDTDEPLIVEKAALFTFLREPEVRALLDCLNQDGFVTKIVGGAVRNTLMGLPVNDIDLATTARPTEVVEHAETFGLKVVPTGIDHGTVTVIVMGTPYEVTTLRRDVATDGRHAQVEFTTSWREDASRRDFTMNALYLDRDGTVTDYVGGIADIERGQVRFIGDPIARIREDYLRILRYFRMYGWYGRGRPDPVSIQACTAERRGLSTLSSERVWSELKRLLAAPDPEKAMLWLRISDVLDIVLPENIGLEQLQNLVKAERQYRWSADAEQRLQAIVPDDVDVLEPLVKRLGLSNAEQKRLFGWATQDDCFSDQPTVDEFAKRLYFANQDAVQDLLYQAVAEKIGADDDEPGRLLDLLVFAVTWRKPDLPISGKDLLPLGIKEGPKMGVILNRLERRWVGNGFNISKEELRDVLHLHK